MRNLGGPEPIQAFGSSAGMPKRLATVAQSREIDRRAQNEYGLSGEVLMEAAGALAAREVAAVVRRLGHRNHRKLSNQISVLCGPGNNGADGLVVARHLRSRDSVESVALLLAPVEKRSELFRLQLQRSLCAGVRIVDLLREPTMGAEILAAAGVYVDALFGSGFRGRIEGEAAQVIERLNQSCRPVIALDGPSGLDADRGIAKGPVVRASLTLTFGPSRPGFFVNQGPDLCGRVRTIPIGYPRELVASVASTHLAFGARSARELLPERSPSSHKAEHGHLTVLAGRPGMWGAGRLAALAGFRIGAGYVTMAGSGEPVEVLSRDPEILTSRLDDQRLYDSTRKRTFAVGPGLGTGDETLQVIRRLRDGGASRVVLDADAITVCASAGLFPVPKDWILTPHAGELARVLRGPDAREIESDRFHFAREAAQITGAIVVLKGFRTVVSDGGISEVILAGNSALAKAGTGDVLTGFIGGLLAQGLSPWDAARLAVYLHGRVADEWIEAGRDHVSLVATDVIERLPLTMARLRIGEAR